MSVFRRGPPEAFGGSGFNPHEPPGWPATAFGAAAIVCLALTTTLFYEVATHAFADAKGAGTVPSVASDQGHELGRLEHSIADADRKLADLVRKLDGLTAADTNNAPTGLGVPSRGSGTTELVDRAAQVPAPADRTSPTRKSARKAAGLRHADAGAATAPRHDR